MDRRGFAGEDADGVAFGVQCEVDEDIDFVGADEVGCLVVGHFVERVPVVSAGFDFGGTAVSAGVERVEEDFKGIVIVVEEEWEDVVADDVGVEIGRDVTDSKAAVWDGIVRGKRGLCGEGAHEAFAPFFVGGKDLLAGSVGVVVDMAKPLAEGVLVQFVGVEFLMHRKSFLYAAGFAQDFAHRKAGFNEFRRDRDELLGNIHRLVETVRGIKCVGEIHQKRRRVGLESDGRFVGDDRVVVAALLGADRPDVAEGEGVVGHERNGALIGFDRFVVTALGLESDAEVIVVDGVRRGDLESFAKMRFCFDWLAGGDQRNAQGVADVRGVGINRRGALQQVERFGVIFQRDGDDAHKVEGFRVVGLDEKGLAVKLIGLGYLARVVVLATAVEEGLEIWIVHNGEQSTIGRNLRVAQ